MHSRTVWDRDRARSPVLAGPAEWPWLRPGRLPGRPARRARRRSRRALHPPPGRQGPGAAVPPVTPADQGHL